MPHLILECSKNLGGVFDRQAVLLELHQLLAGTGMFVVQDIKSRLMEHEFFVVGDGSSGGAFVHLDIRILQGRSDEVKVSLTQKALELLELRMAQALERWRCSVTVEVSDIHRSSYRKLNSLGGCSA